MASHKNLEGTVFGRLTVIERAKNKGNKLMYIASCSCGKTTTVSAGNLINNHTRSCGCLRDDMRRSGKYYHPVEYRAWQLMKDRCLNSRGSRFSSYGGRGITICDRWKNSFDNFYSDMGDRPDGASLDRIDVNGNYEPKNCRWADKYEQAGNKRNSNKCTGVRWDKTRCKWTTGISTNNRYINLGRFKDWFEAVCVRKSAENIYC